MSQIIRNTIRENLHDAFSLEGKKTLFDKIIADQEKYAGKLRPAKNWDLEIGGRNGGQYFHSQKGGETIEFGTYSDGKYYENFSSLQKMMDPFVGITGLQSINKDVVQEYYEYLKGIDHLGILSNYFEANGEMKDQANGLMVTDLGSIIDINMISSFLDPVADKYHILEVGGGYGRLAEVFFNVYGTTNIKYVLLDVVPASLMYSYLYLSKNFPDLRIGFYYHEDPFDMDLFDCYIMPSWHFNISTCAAIFDCCINIQSMQEMNQYHVNYYLSMFNEVLKDDSGIAYISNEKDYIFQGEWNYPKNWNCLMKTRTPRSWTRNSPTEVFIKSAGTFEKENRLVDFIYSLQLKEFDRNLNQQKILSDFQSKLRKSQQEVSGLRNKLQKSQQEVSGLRFELQKSQQEVSDLRNELQKSQQEVSGLRNELQKSQQEVSDLRNELQKSQQEVSDLRFELQKSQQEASDLHSTLSRMPLASEEPTIEKTEECVRILDEYYHSQELPDVILLFENLSKINAHLVAVSLYLRDGQYRKMFLQLLLIGKLDPLVLFSLQTLRIIGNGLLFRLKRT